MASAWGRVLDQANIIKSSFQEVEKAVIKATRHDNLPPKEKHVRRLVVHTHERPELADEIFGYLVKRLEVPDWIIVLKALVVFHRLFRDASPRFIGDVKWRSTSVFPTRFNDPTSGEGFIVDHSAAEAYVQSAFIRKYAQYLEEKVQVFRTLNVEFEKDPSALKGISLDDAFIKLPKLQRQLDALINCQTSAEAITNPITGNAFEMLLKDSFKLYRGLNDGVITLLESYFTLNKKLATNALEIYKAFMRETSSIIAMYEMAKKKFTLELPDLKHAPTTLINSLEDYVRDLDENGQPPAQSQSQFQSQSQPQSQSQLQLQPRAQPQTQPLSLSQPPQHARKDSHLAQPPPAKSQAPPQLLDPFSVEPTVSPQRSNSSLIDPFGVSSHPPAPAVQSANIFDPFGDVPLQPPPVLRQQPSSPSFQQQSTFQFAPTTSGNIARQTTSPDPFASSATYNPFTSPQTSYEEKAQHIKAAYAPTLQPVNTLSPTPVGTTSTGQQQPFPKPNYNVSLNPQPIAQAPYTTSPPFVAPSPFNTSPVPFAPNPPLSTQTQFPNNSVASPFNFASPIPAQPTHQYTNNNNPFF